MKTFRNALVGTALVAFMPPAVGHAQTAIRENGHIITVPPGAVVLIIPRAVAAPMAPASLTAAPQAAAMLRMIAQQQVDMQRMFAQMNAVFRPMLPVFDPPRLFSASFGAGVPMLTMPGGRGVCSQSVTIVQRGGSAPVITRSESGCGAAFPRNPADVRDLPPVSVTPGYAGKLVQADNELPPGDLIAER